MSKINPFKPNSPVPIGMFAGRHQEIKTLQHGLHQTRNGHAANYLIIGERGIGKSSLMTLMKPMARGDLTGLDNEKYNFITVSCTISKNSHLVSLIQLIDKILKRELGKVEKIKHFLNETWSFIQRIKVMDSGIEKNSATCDIDSLIDDFAYSLSETTKRITKPEKGEEKKDGIVIFIDETDHATQELHIGYFFKVVTELLQQHDCNNVMFIVAGLPETIEKMSDSHASSIRIFTQLIIKELSLVDRKYVIEKGLEEANKVNADQTTITDSAKSLISGLSEGYPNFIQQFSYSAFEHNSDGEINETDVAEGAFKTGGALDAIGTRYYKNAYHEQIKSDEYREVLTIMAEKMNEWIKKSEIRDKFSGSDQTLTSALKALTTRNIILKNTSRIGEYRLQQRGFALWIKLFGERNR